MPWTITVVKDPTTTGVGTISGTWTDEAGTFFYSERTPLDDESQDAFLSRANAALEAWRIKGAEESALADSLTAKANAV